MRWRHARTAGPDQPPCSKQDSVVAGGVHAAQARAGTDDVSQVVAPAASGVSTSIVPRKRWGACAPNVGTGTADASAGADTRGSSSSSRPPVVSAALLWLDGAGPQDNRAAIAQPPAPSVATLEWLDATGADHPLKEARDAGRPYWPLAVEQALDAGSSSSSSSSSEGDGADGTSESGADDAAQASTSLTAMGIGSSTRARLARISERNRRQRSMQSRDGRQLRSNRDRNTQRPKAPKKTKSKEQADPADAGAPVNEASLGPAKPVNARNLRRSRKRAEIRGEEVGGAAKAEAAGCVVLIREDCRLHDNPALFHAVEDHPWVVPVYVHADDDPSPWPVRGAGLWWRHESLKYFNQSLMKLGSRICFRKGTYIEEVVNVLMDTGASALYFNRQLEPWHVERDQELESIVVEALGLQVKSFKAMVAAFEPWDVKKKKHEKKGRLEDPFPSVTRSFGKPPQGWPVSLEIEALGYCKTGGRRIPPSFRQYNEKRQQLLECGAADPKQDDWAFEMRRFWRVGEHAAMERLEEFLKDAAWGCYFPPGLHPTDDTGGRFRADKKWTAILSPYLRFGDLSPRYVYARCRQSLPFELRRLFTKRVVWRDKAYAQLYRWPDSHSKSIRSMYEHEHWSGTRLALRRWQRGETGFPLVDAAMRQLWKVGWMCNHLRHVTAQFLIEHLDLNWKDGFAWYDYTLVDTDVAINAMMWQMGGHSGIGAWNFVMHPVYAGKKVDPEGLYVRRWLPELAHLPVEYIHCPWEAPAGTRIAANVLINGKYWQRVIEDLIQARKIHQANVIAVRKRFPEFVLDDGTEIIPLGKGKVIHLEVRDDIRDNDEAKITLMMTPDDPRSSMRRNLGTTKGVHNGIIYDETKRFEAMYDSIGDF